MKIAVLSAHTHSLVWFRVDMMKEFVRNGHEVVAVGPDSEASASPLFEAAGITYRQARVQRNGLNPVKDLAYLLALVALLRIEKPDKVFLYQAKPVVYGGIAARLLGIGDVHALIAGLGSVFRGRSVKSRLIKAVMTVEYWVAGHCVRTMFFHNKDDRLEFTKRGLIPESKTVILNGSGVNLDRFTEAPLPAEPSLLFIGRLIKDKGILDYLAACAKIKQMYPMTRCVLVGPFDSNPSAMTPDELRPFVEAGIVEYFGEQSDVLPFIEQCSVFVLPSYHEGTPKTVLEAMAVGRPIVTTDVPGCRETVVDGLNGYLVPPQDVVALVDAIVRVITNPLDAQRMARESRALAESKYDVKIVNKMVMAAMGIPLSPRKTPLGFDEIRVLDDLSTSTKVGALFPDAEPVALATGPQTKIDW